jgi:aspartate racemase
MSDLTTGEQCGAPLLGVLGGMGPLATVDFLTKLIEETPAQRDADHVPVLAYSVPQIPSRPAAILTGGDSPLPAMLEGIRTLKTGGASAIAIACNTAHYWHAELARAAALPVFHIADAAVDALSARPGARRVGLIATRGTIAAGFFQERLHARDFECLLSSDTDQDELVASAIAAVKRHALDEAHALAVAACERLNARGAEAILLACTEIPPALEHRSAPIAGLCVDPTRALARACAAWWLEARENAISRGAPPRSARPPPTS